MGAHESVIPAVAAPDRRAAAFGLFNAGRGVAWFLGSTAIGILCDYSLAGTITFCAAAEPAAARIFVWISPACRGFEPGEVLTPSLDALRCHPTLLQTGPLSGMEFPL